MTRYKPTVPVQGGFYPAGDFPLYKAEQVEMPDGSLLSEWQGGDQFEIPTIDLVSMGLDPIPNDGTTIVAPANLADIEDKLKKGVVRFQVELLEGSNAIPFETIMLAGSVENGYVYWGSCLIADEEIYLQFVGNQVMAYILTFKTSEDELPYYDIHSMGITAIPLDGTPVQVEMTSSHIQEDLDKGPVRFKVRFLIAEGQQIEAQLVLNKISAEALGAYICATTFDFNGASMLFQLTFTETMITAYVVPLQKQTPRVTAIDMSAFDSAGQITETYEDGTSKTTTIEFDETGNPVKITDGDGNEITLIW